MQNSMQWNIFNDALSGIGKIPVILMSYKKDKIDAPYSTVRCTGMLVSQTMEEGTLKTPIPKCRLYWSFLVGVVKQFCMF